MNRHRLEDLRCLPRASLDDLELCARTDSSTSSSSCRTISSGLGSIDLDAATFAARGGVVEVDLSQPLVNVWERLSKVENVVSVLARESQAYRAVCLRHVVQRAHRKLAAHFGAKLEEQSWAEYLTKAMMDDFAYFKAHKIDTCAEVGH
ncbi:hypothetical protein TSOC_000327 [Tetrabaena socialis]|uniref:Uncharacterized protein n=1 Tax=Tetrabaena socialis TaxID=47790 RepID=A0A2J8AJK1_9CHLO|nr:hypothetical protein TSOC_000327 [Tetrabaena socialis]|eukprot:PNH12690.1 hypothetical protein TSOC_000327 [Tetrabaena socialis]